MESSNHPMPNKPDHHSRGIQINSTGSTKSVSLRSPEDALGAGIHGGVVGAVEVAGELFRVGQRAEDAIASRTVDGAVGDAPPQATGRHAAALDVGVADEEELLGRVPIESGQPRLGSVLGHVVLVVLT